MKIKEMLKSLKKEKGATMIEYALVVGLITLVAVGVLKELGETVSDAFSNVKESLEDTINQ